MIHAQAVCFDCEKDIESLSQIVFAPPFDDIRRGVSACFHGLCLMRWRERRAEVRASMQDAYIAFVKHVTGECGCE